MTEKQSNIINKALELFANKGYHSVSTSQIASEAEVSEGLIFRHFKNKKGLLEALMKQAEEQMSELVKDIAQEPNPSEVIRKSIELPFQVKKKDYCFWQLQFKLKWEAEYHNPQKLQPWIDKMTWAFEQLKYEEPKMEALKLSTILESVSIQLLRNELKK